MAFANEEAAAVELSFHLDFFYSSTVQYLVTSKNASSNN